MAASNPRIRKRQIENSTTCWEKAENYARSIAYENGWTKRVPEIGQAKNRYDNELPLLRLIMSCKKWLREFVEIIYLGMFNPGMCTFCNSCTLPGKLIASILDTFVYFNQLEMDRYSHNEYQELNNMRDSVKSTGIKNIKLCDLAEEVVESVCHNENETRCCDNAKSYTPNEVANILLPLIDHYICDILEMMVMLSIANTHQTTLESDYSDQLQAGYFGYTERHAPEEAGLVAANKLFDYINEITSNATGYLNKHRKDKKEQQ